MSISKTNSNSSEEKGLGNKVKNFMGKGLDKLLSLPDKPESAAGRKAARIAADLLMSGLGVGLLAAMSNGFSPATLTNPSLPNMMSMPLGMGATGTGLAWLLQDSISKKYHRGLGKIMACVMPLLIAGASSSFIAAGFQSKLPGPTTLGAYWLVGLLVLPLAAFAVGWGGKKFGQDEVYFVQREAPVTSHARNENRKQSLRATRRVIDLDQEESSREHLKRVKQVKENELELAEITDSEDSSD